MSKRQRKHNHVVSSVLAAALAFTAIVSSVQLASVSDDLAANVSGRYVAVLTCANGAAPLGDGTCADGTAPIDNAGGADPATQCATNGGVWNAANYFCDSSAGGDGGGTIQCNSLNNTWVPQAECTAANTAKNSCTTSGGTWNGSGTGSCTPAGGDGTASSYANQADCESHYYFWYNNVCNSTAQAGAAADFQNCPTGEWWYPADSVVTVGQCTSLDLETFCLNKGFTLGTDNKCKSGGTIPAGTCPDGYNYLAGSYPNGPCVGHESAAGTNGQACTGATPFQWGDGSCHAAAQTEGSCTTGTSWDPDTSTCRTSTPGTQCGQGQYWNGTSCVNTFPTDVSYPTAGAVDTVDACTGRRGTWNAATSTCSVPPGGTMQPPTQPATYQDYFVGPQCSRDASHIDAFCFGFHQWNDQAACEAYDENRDGKPDYEWDSTRSDCYPKFGMAVGPMMPPPMPFGGKMIPGVATGTTQSTGADFTQWMKVGGTEDFCSTTTGRDNPGCAFQRMQGTKSTMDIYGTIMDSAKTSLTGPTTADFKAFGEVSQMADRMRFETGGAYCPQLEQIGKVLYEAEANKDTGKDTGLISAVAAGADTYIDQLKGCGDVNRFHELTELRSKVDALPASQGKDDLLAKIDVVSADPKALDNPRVMGDLWKAYGMLQHKLEQDRAEEGPCNSIERIKGDIGDYLSGAHDVEFRGEAPPKEVIEGVVVEIETALAEAKRVGGSEGKKVCQDMKEKLKRMERIYFGNEGFLYDPMTEYMGHLYGDFDYINSQTMMYEGMEGVDLKEIEAFIRQTIMERFTKMKDEIIATIRAEFKTALGTTVDWDALILESPILSGATTAVSDVTESFSVISGRAEEIQRQAAEDLASDLEQLPPALVDSIYAGREKVFTELLQPILTVDPEVLEEVKGPFEDLLEIVVSQPLPEEIVEELTAYTLVGPITNAIKVSGVANANGIYIIEDEDDKAVVVEILRDGITDALEIVEPERLKRAQIEAGFRVDFPDIVGDEWHVKSLLGRVADGSTHGEGDGTANPSGTVLGAHIVTTMQRMLGVDAGTSLPSDQASGMDAWIHKGAALAVEAGAVDSSNVTEVMFEPASRGETLYMGITMITHENPDIRKLMDELTCTLNDDDLADTNCDMEHADEINFAVNAGIVRGNEAADGTRLLNADSDINRAESWTMQGRMKTFLAEVETVGFEEMLDRMSGTSIIDPIYTPTSGTGGTSIGDPTGNRDI